MRLNIEPADILNLKQILTLLGYNTLQCLCKLNSKSEIETIELEFFKLKERSNFATDFPNLVLEKFGPGTKMILADVVTQVKRGILVEKTDLNANIDQVYEECQKVSCGMFFLFLQSNHRHSNDFRFVQQFQNRILSWI